MKFAIDDGCDQHISVRDTERLAKCDGNDNASVRTQTQLGRSKFMLARYRGGCLPSVASLFLDQDVADELITRAEKLSYRLASVPGSGEHAHLFRLGRQSLGQRRHALRHIRHQNLL